MSGLRGIWCTGGAQLLPEGIRNEIQATMGASVEKSSIWAPGHIVRWLMDTAGELADRGCSDNKRALIGHAKQFDLLER
ncbi:MAG: hypothetical protein ACLPXB_04055 [Thiobacillaceae bacterium]